MAAVRWDPRKFGTAADPVRQSALNSIASQNGCPKRYFYEREADAAGTTPPRRASWKPVLGTAVHAVIERGLNKTWALLESLYGPEARPAERPADAKLDWAPDGLRRRIEEVLREELERECVVLAGVDETGAPRPALPIEWYDDKPDTEIAAGVAMALGALRTTVERAESVVGTEVPFRAELEGYELEGTIDLLYRRRGDGALCLADWKTGERKLPQILLDYGYQPATYSYAVEHGRLWAGTDSEAVVGEHPAELHIVHLRDFVPYVKKPRAAGKGVGDLRGPGWYASQRRSEDRARLGASLRAVVGTVRMNRRLEALGEQCARCPFKSACLGDGYAPVGDEARDLAALVRDLDLGDASDLSD
jgi:hypothetical protein